MPIKSVIVCRWFASGLFAVVVTTMIFSMEVAVGPITWWQAVIAAIEFVLIVWIASQESSERKFRLLMGAVCLAIAITWSSWVTARGLISPPPFDGVGGGLSSSINYGAFRAVDFLGRNSGPALVAGLFVLGYPAFMTLQARKSHMKRQTS